MTARVVMLPFDGQPVFEVVAEHAASCRVNLIIWDLTEIEAVRILRALEDAQRQRQGNVMVSGKAEAGWTYRKRKAFGR